MEACWYIIKHVPTGGHLPNGNGRGGRGFTHQEVVGPDDPWPPRLFHTEAAARQALSWWLRGITTVSYAQHYDGWGNADDSEDWHTEPVPERKAEDMKIVRVRIIADV